MKAHYKDIVKGNEAAIAYYLGIFNPDERIMYCSYGYPEYAINCVPIEIMTSGYYCFDSAYYNNENLLYVMNCLIDYLYTAHRPDYTVDNRISDYCCGPILLSIYLVRAYKIMEKYAKTKEQIDLKKRLRKYLEWPALGICNGGTITPNHRWMAVSSALFLYTVVKMEKLKELAYAYLNEGVDIDEFGEYTERSPMYNNHCNNAFIIIAEETKDDSYLEYVQKNLELMFNYIEPDFTMFTQNSNRKDKQEGDVSASFYPHGFYDAYMYMSYLTKDGRFAKMADDIFCHIKKINGKGPGSLWAYHLHPELTEYKPKMEDYPKSFNIFHKDIVRRRKDDFSVTLLTKSPNFLFIQRGGLRCFIRICASFFAVAQFIPQEIEEIEADKYYITMKAEGKYHGPMPEKPSTTVWREMEHYKRPEINKVYLTYHITVSLEDSKVSLDIKTQGMDQVPYKIEFCLTSPGKVEYNGKEQDASLDGFLCVDAKQIKVTKDNDSLILTDSFCKHTYHKDMRGSIAPSKNVFTVYYTDFTHIDKRIEIIGTREEK